MLGHERLRQLDRWQRRGLALSVLAAASVALLAVFPTGLPGGFATFLLLSLACSPVTLTAFIALARAHAPSWPSAIGTGTMAYLTVGLALMLTLGQVAPGTAAPSIWLLFWPLVLAVFPADMGTFPL